MTDKIITCAKKVSNSRFWEGTCNAASYINYLGRVIAYIPIVSMPIGGIRVISSICNIIAAPLYAKINFEKENNNIKRYLAFANHNNLFLRFGDYDDKDKYAILTKEYRKSYLEDLGFGVLELTNLKLGFRLLEVVID